MICGKPSPGATSAMWRKILSSVVSDISETIIFRATYLLFLKRYERPRSTAMVYCIAGGKSQGENVPQVMGEPNGREGALAEVADCLVLAIVEDVAENDGMITTWAIVFHPLTEQGDGLESLLFISWRPRWRDGRRGVAHTYDGHMLSRYCADVEQTLAVTCGCAWRCF